MKAKEMELKEEKDAEREVRQTKTNSHVSRDPR